MPAVSAKQYGFMQAARAGKLTSLNAPSPKVANDFIEHTSPVQRSKFAKALAVNRKRKPLSTN